MWTFRGPQSRKDKLNSGVKTVRLYYTVCRRTIGIV